MKRFAVAYLFWLVVFLGVAAALWFSSSELSVFRYAGF